MRLLPKEAFLTAGVFVLVVMIIGSFVGYYSVNSSSNDLSISDVKLNSLRPLQNTYGLMMNLSFKVDNNLPHGIHLNSVNYVLSADNEWIGSLHADSLIIPPSSSKNVNIIVNVTDPQALKVVNKSLTEGHMVLGVGLNYATDVKMFNALTFTKAMHNVHTTQQINLSKFIKHPGLLRASSVPSALKILKVEWLVNGKPVDVVTNFQKVTVKIWAVITKNPKEILEKNGWKYLAIFVKEDYAVLSDPALKKAVIPDTVKVGETYIYSISFTAEMHFLLRGYYIVAGYASNNDFSVGGGGGVPMPGCQIFWTMSNHYPPRLKIIEDPSYSVHVQWLVDGHAVTSVHEGTLVYAKITVGTSTGLPVTDLEVCIREDIAHGSDHDVTCVTYLTPDIPAHSTYVIRIGFKANYHHHSHFFYSTYTRGYFVTVKFTRHYAVRAYGAWEMSNHYPPRLKVNK